MTTRWIDTPIGGLRLHAQAALLTAIDFDAEPRGSRVADPVLDQAEQQLTEYFDGTRTEFDLPLASEGSEFQKKVWKALRGIPAGATQSYAQLAARIGHRAAVRATGAANGANPISIVVPCHRLIGSTGALTGYGGGIERKRWLLDHEARAAQAS